MTTDMPSWAVDPFEYDFGATGDDLVADQLTIELDGKSLHVTTEHRLTTPDEHYLIEAFVPTVRAERNQLVWLVLLQGQTGDGTIGIELPDLTEALSDGEITLIDESESSE